MNTLTNSKKYIVNKSKNFLPEKNIFLKLFFKNYFFLFFSFFNCTFPLMITLIIASSPISRGFNDLYAIISLGAITSFLVTFYQIGFLFTTTLLTMLISIKKKNNHFSSLEEKHILGYQLLSSLLVGIVLIPCFIGLSYAYLSYSIHNNLISEIGQQFIYGSSPTVLLVLLNSTVLFTIFYRIKNWKTTLIAAAQYVISVLMIAAVGLPSCSIKGIGVYGYTLGLLAGDIINLMLVLFIAWYLNISYSIRYFFQDFKELFKVFAKMLRFSFVSLFALMFKTIIIFLVGYTAKTTQVSNSDENNYLLAKLIYIYILYPIPFFSAGCGQILTYLKGKYKSKPEVFYSTYRSNWILMLMVFLITLLSILIFRFTAEPLFTYYIGGHENLASWEGIKENMLYSSTSNNWTYLIMSFAVMFSSISASSKLSILPKKPYKGKFTKYLNWLKPIFIGLIKMGSLMAIFIGLKFGFESYSPNPFEGFKSLATAFICVNFGFLVYDLINWRKTNLIYEKKYFEYLEDQKRSRKINEKRSINNTY